MPWSIVLQKRCPNPTLFYRMSNGERFQIKIYDYISHGSMTILVVMKLSCSSVPLYLLFHDRTLHDGSQSVSKECK